MNHSIFIWCQLNKRTKFKDSDNFSCHHHSCLDFCHNILDHPNCSVDHFLICATDRNIALFTDVNLYTSFFNNLIDDLTLLSNNITNLCWINCDLFNLWCKFTQLCSRCINTRLHTILHNKVSCLMTSRNSTLHNVSSETMNLDIHLDSSNSCICSCYLKVHIAKEIFKSLNIGKQYIFIIALSCD